MRFEYWRPIAGFEGLYEVSNYGNVRSLNYRGKKGVVNILSQRNHSKGYLTVCLRKNGKTHNRFIHRLVAEAFLENPNSLKEIDHKNRNKTDNFVFVNPDGSVDHEQSNLRWASRKDNNNNMNRPYKAVLQYDLQGNFIKKYESIAEAEKITGVNTGNIVSACKNRYKQMNGFIWSYA